MRTFYVLTTFLLFSRLVPAQTPQSGSSDTHTATALQYDDPVNGVKFRYPVSWLLNQGGTAYIPAVALENNGNPAEPYKPEGYVYLQGRDASQGPYRNTNFINGWFLYRVVSGVGEEWCYRKADFADVPSTWPRDEWKADWVTIGGVRFRHGSGSAQALCNQSSQDVYATLHLNKCYLFEKQINTICEHGDNLHRDITPKELMEINRAFDAVMQSVRLKNSGSAGSSH